MKIFLTDQSSHLAEHLELLKRVPIAPFRKEDLHHKRDITSIQTKRRLSEIDLSFLFDYKIFPLNIIVGQGEWQLEKRLMRVGDTIAQQAFIPPFPHLSQKVIFGVRINEVINENTRRGFSYETLEGHVEKGQSIFTVEETQHGIIFKIETFSAPGNFLTKLVGPIFTRPYQAYCTKKALENVKNQINRQ